MEGLTKNVEGTKSSGLSLRQVMVMCPPPPPPPFFYLFFIQYSHRAGPAKARLSKALAVTGLVLQPLDKALHSGSHMTKPACAGTSP